MKDVADDDVNNAVNDAVFGKEDCVTIDDDVKFVMNHALVSGWNAQKTLSELSVLRAFNDVPWSNLGPVFLKFLLHKVLTPSMIRKNGFMPLFRGVFGVWKDAFAMMFPQEEHISLLGGVCEHMSESEMDEWRNHTILLECFSFLHSEKYVCTKAFETWVLQGWLCINVTAAYKCIDISFLNDFLNKIKN